MSTSNKKRKVELDNRKFNERWENEFLFTDFGSKPQCLVCLQVVSVMKEYNIRRHYESTHKVKFGSVSGEARLSLVRELKSKMQKQKNTFFKATHVQKSSLQASYEVCAIMAKHQMPFRSGELIKRCAIKMANSFGDEKVAKNFETVSLSHQTVSRRILEINEQLDTQLRKEITKSEYFSIALDESTDITDVCQLLVFIRTVDNKFSIKEELLDLVPLPTSAKGSDIYNALVSVVDKYGGFSKCSCVVTDGAKCMTGKKTGLVGLLSKTGVNVSFLHCIIHQEVLCSKFVKLNEVMKDVTRIVNLIRGGNRAQGHRKLVQFLQDLSAECYDIPLHSEIRWLSAGKTLKAFFSIRNEVCQFLEANGKVDDETIKRLKNEEWLCTLAFLTDITEHLNTLNLKLQGRKQNICQLVSHIEAFRKKVTIFEEDLKKSDLKFFKSCSEMKNENSCADFTQFGHYFTQLREEFEVRFSDFDNLKTTFQLYVDPMTAKIEDQDPELQMELCELQSDFLLTSNTSLKCEEFWKLVMPNKYPKLHNFALKVTSMFGSTYICECAFSTMKSLKSKQRNKLSQEALKSTLRIVTTEMEADIPALVDMHTAQSSH